MAFYLIMRAVLLIIVFLTAATVRIAAQQRDLGSSSHGTNSAALTKALESLSLTAADTSKATSNISLGNQLTISGPVVETIKVKRISDAPRRVLQLINPFSPLEHVDQVERTSNLTTRAWATTVGTHPGAPAFPDVTTHESTLSLMAIGR